MTTVCDFNNCCACKACMAVCKKKAVTTTDGISHFSSRINSELCIDCGLCKEICIAHSKSDDASEPILWKQGWALDDNVRASSASGGAAAAVSKAFIEHGGAVCGCCYSDGVFKFKIAHTENELGQLAGSKYVKSDPDDIYSEIKNELAQAKRYCSQDYHVRLMLLKGIAEIMQKICVLWI